MCTVQQRGKDKIAKVGRFVAQQGPTHSPHIGLDHPHLKHKSLGPTHGSRHQDPRARHTNLLCPWHKTPLFGNASLKPSTSLEVAQYNPYQHLLVYYSCHARTRPFRDCRFDQTIPFLTLCRNHSTQLIMGKTNWSQDFCLGCDRQTDGKAYCVEGCRRAEYARTMSGCKASSPASHHVPILWSTRSGNNFYLPTAYDFRQQKSSTSGQVQLPEEARRELGAYASSFDQSRQYRRQSDNNSSLPS
ncbi:hypothetical protein O988_01541 [Pseudogymnoascus sp. VKM F-3808]|nr:hypothetical protein O988_01541 [Pseudogymnoascus sp. VKM F-3808]